MKGALVGFGFISSQGHLPAYFKTPGFDIVAVADICAQRRELAQKLLPEARVYADHEELLRRERALDFIDVATPPRDHAAITLAGLARGLHVLCEKPLTATPEEARRVILAAQDARRVVMPCHNYKHAPVVRALRRLIERGVLGTVRTATINTYRTTHARGVMEWDTHWRRKQPIAGGGIGMDHGSHSFYLAFLLMDDYPCAVTGKTFCGDARFDTEDTVSCTLTFPKGLANIYLTWQAGVRKVIYTVHGDQGAAIIDDDALLVTPLGAQTQCVVSNFDDASHSTWYTSLFEQFRGAVQRGDCLNRELCEAYHCLQLIHLVYRSSDSGGVEQRLDTCLSFLDSGQATQCARAA